MSQTQGEFTSLLIRRKVVSAAQLEGARKLQRQTGSKLEDVLVQFGYASSEQVRSVLAEMYSVPMIDLTALTIPPEIIERIPESVARENRVIPIADDGSVLTVAISDPDDQDTIQKLQFILNKDIQVVLAPLDQIIAAINRHYGRTEVESVDSMLAEFTDTAIDFSESESIFQTDFEPPHMISVDESEASVLSDSDTALESSSFCLSLDDELKAADSSPVLACLAQAPDEKTRTVRDRCVTRQATIRYYHRMNPERMFPLLVVISRKAIQEVVKRHVAQKQSESFQVTLDSMVEIEPILPGCYCFPTKEQVRIQPGETTARFWVVPHVLGEVMHARVVVRQDGRVLAEVPLEIRVVKQTITLFMGAMNLLVPFVSTVAKQSHLSFLPSSDEGFGLYAALAGWVLLALSPEVLTGLLLTATLALYLWFRPRQRDVFWDIQPAAPDPSRPRSDPADDDRPEPVKRDVVLATSDSDHQAALFAEANRLFVKKDYPAALKFYESGLSRGKTTMKIYHHASLAAWQSGQPGRALAILQEAEARLGTAKLGGSIWYNMGCFATRLGRFSEACRYLQQAVDRGFKDRNKFESDPDLEALRWQPDFKRLLRALPRKPGTLGGGRVPQRTAG